jgi:nucleoside-diphosphate-sugar epimerase
MQLLVTGGAGYVGSTLTGALLAEGHSVRVLDSLAHGGRGLLGFWAHPKFEFLRGDVRDLDLARRAVDGVDGVVHLAAIVGDPACARDPDLARSVNLEATLQILDLARKAGTGRFLFASTCSNYGRMADPSQFVSETSELAPVSLYAETKVAAEQAILAAAGDPFCTTVLRLSTVYGVSPRMRFDLTVNEFTAEMLIHARVVIYGEQFWRPYVHVRDVARAVLRIVESSPDVVSGEVFNVGDDSQNFRKRDLVAMIGRRLPDATVEYVKKDEDPRDYRVSFEKIAGVLGYRISRTVQDGIDEVIAAIRDGVITDFDDPIYRN